MGITMAISLASGNVACLPTNRPEIGGPFWTFILWGGLAGGLGSGVGYYLHFLSMRFTRAYGFLD